MPAGSALLRVSGLHAGLRFPSASNTGATLPGSLFTVSGTTSAAAANSALGISTNAGWTHSGSGFSLSANAVLDSLAGAIGCVIGVNGVTLQNCSFAAAGGLVQVNAGVNGTTISNSVFASSGGGSIPVIECQAGAATSNTLITDCTISGTDATANRAPYAFNDLSSQGTGIVIQRCNMFWCAKGIGIGQGTVRDNYIHDLGFLSGDHCECIVLDGTSGPLLIAHNTLLNPLNQTAAIDMSTTTGSSAVTSVTIDGNLLAGGTNVIYCGNSGTAGQRNWQVTDTGCAIGGGTTLTDAALVAGDAGATVTGTGIPAGTTIGTPSGGAATLSQACTNGSGLSVTLHYTAGVAITNNRFSQMFYPGGGNGSTHVNFDTAVASNIWAGNVFHDTGAAIPA